MRHRLSSLSLLLVSCLFALCLMGCGPRLVPFTHELRVQHNLTSKDLKNLQFYISHEVTLRRELESGGSQVTPGHKLLLLSGKSIEEVVIEKHTPGVATEVSDRALAVSFEAGFSMIFAASAEPGTPSPSFQSFATAPDPFPGNPSSPQPEPIAVPSGAFGGSYWLATEEGGRVPYQGRLFEAVEQSLRAHLLIDAESLEEVVESRTVLPGVRLQSK
ncbi:hypothetical protein [Chondromyces apiculatus]|uniref:Uncharacterized protein n=1 Tax=Chondromyces apiculatus DSM 436 TaxID=1192034 RepID=A0A017SUM5_9BACT|nr:hypothetical protein [Chondromyces apiculatus]EYF00664.1 Hypothetical protein CAP_0355 [Chondromyces apiculatus DSM 436]